MSTVVPETLISVNPICSLLTSLSQSTDLSFNSTLESIDATSDVDLSFNSTVVPETPPTAQKGGYTEEEKRYLRFMSISDSWQSSGTGNTSVDDENAVEDATVARGPMYAFMKRSASAEKLSKEKMRQQNVKESLDKKTIGLVHQNIARFWCQAGLSFKAIRLPSFEIIVRSIGEFGKHLPIPSYHNIRVPLLNKEMEHTESLLEKKMKE
ncbi:hypothetical protein SASPL_111582 [Salvia splendens]|uniref:Uncharacterized protein n=1 Tax=Salvia splendens TaxID=180675 RepID=A0A8X8YC69_SALSN|nr:hypothetical protein SASPL_111582 [Salvia splendens]